MCSAASLVFLLILGSAFNGFFVDAFSAGAPDFACVDMVPTGHEVSPQRSPFPYKISCRQTDSDTITVEVKGQTFKGLLVQVRGSSGSPVGSFSVPGNQKLKTACSGQAGTHESSIQKDSAEFKVKLSPGAIDNTLRCVATVVREKETFWVKETALLELSPSVATADVIQAAKNSSPGGANKSVKKQKKRGRKEKKGKNKQNKRGKKVKTKKQLKNQSKGKKKKN